MAGKRQRANGTWEYVFKRTGVLDKPLYMTFDTEEEGDAYAAKLDALLKRGIAPEDLTPQVNATTIKELINAYETQAQPSNKDRGCLQVVVEHRGHALLTEINVNWVDAWILEMKLVEKNAPATIRAKVGALSRACEWGVRKNLMALPDAPFRSLPNGYSQYTDEEAKKAGMKRVDVERDRRLEPGEHERILAVLDGAVLPRKARPYTLPYPKAVRLLYVLALESAMRLREMFTLTVQQVNLSKKTVFLDKTKNGSKRQVPLSSVALSELSDYLTNHRELPKGCPNDLVFPWWDGKDESLDSVSDFLSKLFHNERSPGIFDVAKCEGLKFHDLRHEATSRLFERTKLSELQIMKITGHKSQRMLMRYANLRASDLANSLWIFLVSTGISLGCLGFTEQTFMHVAWV